MSTIVYIQAVLAVLISLGILLQQRASGLSSSMGGSGVTYVQRRGAEKVLYQGVIVLGIIFALLTVLDWFI